MARTKGTATKKTWSFARRAELAADEGSDVSNGPFFFRHLNGIQEELPAAAEGSAMDIDFQVSVFVFVQPFSSTKNCFEARSGSRGRGPRTAQPPHSRSLKVNS